MSEKKPLKYKRRDELEAEIKTLEKEYRDLEYKFGCILDTVTGGCISKPHTDKAIIDEAIQRQVLKEWEYAIKDYKESNPLPAVENTICKWTRSFDNHFNISCVSKTGERANGNFKGKDIGAKWEFIFCPYCGGEIELDAE